jgi:hypothetical protein
MASMSSPPPQPLPADPALGAVQSHHPSNRLRPLIVAAIIGAPVMVILNFTLAQSEAWYGRPLTVIIVAALGLALGWYVLHIWNREIVLYERGFSYREGSKTVYFLYSEVKSIRLRAEVRAYFGGLWRRGVYRFTVTTILDDQFAITNVYSRASELGKTLEGQINALLRPRLRARLDMGERVGFGAFLALDREHVYAGGRALLWADYGGYGVSAGALLLRDKTSAVWARLPLVEVENLTLLVELLRAFAPPPQTQPNSTAARVDRSASG